MKTLTIELPEDLAARLLAILPPEEINAFAVALLEDALDQDADRELPEDLKDALREGKEDLEAGRFYPAEEMDARMEAFLQERREARERENAARAAA
jgi:hypothetical protein